MLRVSLPYNKAGITNAQNRLIYVLHKYLHLQTLQLRKFITEWVGNYKASIDLWEISSLGANSTPKVHKAVNKGDMFFLYSNWWWVIYVLGDEGNEFLNFGLHPGEFLSKEIIFRAQRGQGLPA